MNFLRYASANYKRGGIANGGEFYMHPPELLPDFLISINNKSRALFVRLSNWQKGTQAAVTNCFSPRPSSIAHQ